MIRAARREDVSVLVRMGLRFIADSRYGRLIAANREALRRLMIRLIEAEPATVLVLEQERPVGMFGAHLFHHPMSDELVAAEAFWWVEPEHRGNGMWLLRAGEAWARKAGAAKFQMIAPDERTAQAYRALGFEKVEEHFQKDL